MNQLLGSSWPTPASINRTLLCLSFLIGQSVPGRVIAQSIPIKNPPSLHLLQLRLHAIPTIRNSTDYLARQSCAKATRSLQHIQSSNSSGSIECEVKDSKGIPHEAVLVLRGSGTTMQWTDQNGRIRFPGLGPGKYQVAVCAKGFYPELRTVRVKPGKVARIRIRLRTSGNATSGCEGIGKSS